MTGPPARTHDFPFDDGEWAGVLADGLSRDSAAAEIPSGRSKAAVDAALDRLLSITHSRATGLWRATDEFLIQVAFRAVPDMPADVREEFRRITTQLPLAQTDLGVVKAAVTGQPVAAYRTVKAGGLSGSATWLERFACRQSLAVPIYTGEHLRGVIAISTPEEFTAESDTWKRMVELARAIGENA
ncbi:MAG: GAF domain-containing protein [Planctomycetaceae bacterium]